MDKYPEYIKASSVFITKPKGCETSQNSNGWWGYKLLTALENSLVLPLTGEDEQILYAMDSIFMSIKFPNKPLCMCFQRRVENAQNKLLVKAWDVKQDRCLWITRMDKDVVFIWDAA